MVLSMPIMTAHHHDSAVADPFMRWTMRTVDAPLRALLPPLYAVDPGVLVWALLAITMATVVFAGRGFYVRAWASVRRRSPDMSTLVALGTGAALVASVAATIAPQAFVARGLAPDVYYEAVTAILALVLLGNTLEARAKGRTSAALAALARCARRPRGSSSKAAPSATSPSRTCARATSSSCGPASACPSTASSCPATARWTSRCSRASRCPCRSARATRWSAAR
jgi:P-type Cu+ transporter